MSNTIYSNYSKITARLWFNSHYGKGTGPKRINHILYNGSVEYENLGIKHWIDLADFDHMQDSFHHRGYRYWSDAVYEMAETIGYVPQLRDDFVAGQLISAVNPKQYAEGFVVADIQKMLMFVYWHRDPNPEFAKLPINVCSRRNDKIKSPDLLATNCDLSTSPTPAPTTASMGTKIDLSERLQEIKEAEEAEELQA